MTLGELICPGGVVQGHVTVDIIEYTGLQLYYGPSDSFVIHTAHKYLSRKVRDVRPRLMESYPGMTTNVIQVSTCLLITLDKEEEK